MLGKNHDAKNSDCKLSCTDAFFLLASTKQGALPTLFLHLYHGFHGKLEVSTTLFCRRLEPKYDHGNVHERISQDGITTESHLTCAIIITRSLTTDAICRTESLSPQWVNITALVKHSNYGQCRQDPHSWVH